LTATISQRSADWQVPIIGQTGLLVQINGRREVAQDITAATYVTGMSVVMPCGTWIVTESLLFPQAYRIVILLLA
jgi:hypothetical protein